MTSDPQILIVDGEPVRLCGGRGPLTPEAAEALADVVRAARAVHAAQPARCLAQPPTDDGDLHYRRPPCLEAPDHEPPHRNGAGREWT